MKKIMNVKHNPYFLEAFFDENAKAAPYMLYTVYVSPDRYGYPAKHRRLLVKADRIEQVFSFIAAMPGKAV